MMFRRALADRIRSSASAVWPILFEAGRKPENWRGWPERKQFAFVLTHDVEGQTGVERCAELAALERTLGFRSSFNFIPEGAYKTPVNLRDHLAATGFEVGVHDLRHDGKLYRSEREFRRAAAVINRYLEEWGAVGFRSGFMHHNMEWLHALEISYDMSTFDTDPFEPQPDGVHTIFPFWVSDPKSISNLTGSSRGYVEMPYTLPQDFTLFSLLREKGIDIWKRKLDWVVEKGGMALLNVHPDYLNFNEQRTESTYPVRFYREFLDYVRSSYGSCYWNALPRDVAAFVCDARRSKAVELVA